MKKTMLIFYTIILVVPTVVMVRSLKGCYRTLADPTNKEDGRHAPYDAYDQHLIDMADSEGMHRY